MNKYVVNLSEKKSGGNWKIEWGDYCGDLFFWILKLNLENQPVVTDRENKQKASFYVRMCVCERERRERERVCLCVCVSCGEVTQVRQTFFWTFCSNVLMFDVIIFIC